MSGWLFKAVNGNVRRFRRLIGRTERPAGFKYNRAKIVLGRLTRVGARAGPPASRTPHRRLARLALTRRSLARARSGRLFPRESPPTPTPPGLARRLARFEISARQVVDPGPRRVVRPSVAPAPPLVRAMFASARAAGASFGSVTDLEALSAR